MADDSGANGIMSNLVSKLIQVLVICGILLGAYLSLDAKIGNAVEKETLERKEADARVERVLGDIRAELRDLNKYLRDHPK